MKVEIIKWLTNKINCSPKILIFLLSNFQASESVINLSVIFVCDMCSIMDFYRRTDYLHSNEPQNKAKFWQVPINFKGRKLFSRTKVIIIP